MRQIPTTIASRLDTQLSPGDLVLFADVYWQTEGTDSLASAYRLRGDADVSTAEGSNITYDELNGALLLTQGTAQALDSASPAAAYSQLLDASVSITEIVRWVKPTTASRLTPTHAGWSYIHGGIWGERQFAFTAQSSKLVNSLALGLGNSGDLSANVYVQLADFDTGLPLGNVAVVAVPGGSAHAVRTPSGTMGARIYAGKRYILRLWLQVTTADNMIPRAWWCRNEMHYCKITLGGLNTSASDWVIPLYDPATNAPLGAITQGGTWNYAASGSLVRNLDVKAIPLASGNLSINSVVPLGSALSIDALYATNDPAVSAETPTVPAHWTLVSGPYTDGMSIPAYRYWRIAVSMTPNGGRDQTPQLLDVNLTFSGLPLVFGTKSESYVQNGDTIVRAVRALNNVSSSSQSLDPQLKTTMVGEIKLELAPEDEVKMLATMKLRGKRVDVRAGISGVTDTVPYYTGVINELAYSAGRYILTLQDPVNLADVSLPSTKQAPWSAAATYALGAIVTSGNNAYSSLQNGNLNHAVTDGAWWAAYSSVWVPITYASGTHLADIALDLLANRINLPDRYINAKSIADVKAARPTRTIVAQRVFDQPTKAKQMLDELALLLEAQWVTRAGKLCLVADPAATDHHVETLNKHDIKESLQWKRGFASVKNVVLMLSGYSKSGTSEQFSQGDVIVSADSLQNYGMSVIQQIPDRFGLSASELATIGSNYMARWNDGKRVISCEARLGKLNIECGDLIRISSGQLPESEPQDVKCMVIQSQLDWAQTFNKLTLLEV